MLVKDVEKIEFRKKIKMYFRSIASLKTSLLVFINLRKTWFAKSKTLLVRYSSE